MSSKYKMVFGEDMGFADKNAVRAYIDYLFRTDKEQRWTDKSTEEDHVVIFEEGEKILSFAGDADSRRAFARRVDMRCQKEGIYDSSLHALRKTTVDFCSKDIKHYDSEMISLFAEVVNKMYENSEIEPIAAVTHEEPEEDMFVRFGLLYINNSENQLVEIL